MPKNKDANDAWVKGAQFIDLVGLGMKDNPNDKPKADAVYIKPNVNTQGQF